jgi:hypothetical protein
MHNDRFNSLARSQRPFQRPCEGEPHEEAWETVPDDLKVSPKYLTHDLGKESLHGFVLVDGEKE